MIFFNNTNGTGPNEDVRQALVPFGIPYLGGMRNALVAMAHWIGPPSAGVAFAASAAVDTSGIKTALSQGPMRQTALFRLLRDNGVPMAPCEAVSDAAEATASAAALGYPVVLKGCADELAHKTELGLVRLGLQDADAVRTAHRQIDTALGASPTREIVVQPMMEEGIELIVAARNEPGFGTVLVVGLGGILVEFIKSVSVRLGPVDAAEARAMLDECRAGEMLAGLRGKGPYDIAAAAAAIAALSRFAAAAGPYIGALEINPLIVGAKGAVGVDVLLTPPAPGHI
jgi:acetyltransferase